MTLKVSGGPLGTRSFDKTFDLCKINPGGCPIPEGTTPLNIKRSIPRFIPEVRPHSVYFNTSALCYTIFS